MSKLQQDTPRSAERPGDSPNSGASEQGDFGERPEVHQSRQLAFLTEEIAALREEIVCLRQELANSSKNQPSYRIWNLGDFSWIRRAPSVNDVSQRIAVSPAGRAVVATKARVVHAVPAINERWLPTMHLGGLVLVAVAQGILATRYGVLNLPQRVEDTLRPVWPDTAPALVAIVLFFVAMLIYGYSTRHLLDDRPPHLLQVIHSSQPTRLERITLALGGIGLLIQVWIALRLAFGSYQPSYPRWFLVSIVLLLAAVFWQERRRWQDLRLGSVRRLSTLLETSYVVAMLALFFYLSTFDLDHWRYASIGDEHAFYSEARQFTEGGIVRNLFSQQGVYGYHPLLSSYATSVQMRVFGSDVVGWKTASIVSAVGALALLYALARSLYGRRVAILALGLLASAHYLLAFAHTGYNNLDALFPALGALFCSVLGMRHSSRLLLVLSGAFAGLGWYTFYSSRTAILLLGLIVLVSVRPRRWLKSGMPILAGFVSVVLPFFAVNGREVIDRMLVQTSVGNTGEVVANEDLMLYWNLGRTLLAFNYNTKNYLYVSGSLAEPLTAALFLLGVGYAIATWRDARSRLILAWLGLGLLATGVASQYDHVTVTRLHYVLPAVALLAALAVDRSLRVWQRLASPDGYRVFAVSVVALILVVATVSNLYRWFVVSPATAPTSERTVIVRVLREQVCHAAPLPPIVLDTHGDGAINAAMTDNAGVRPAELALYSDSPVWVGTAGERCVILRRPETSEAQAAMMAMATRWPMAVANDEYDASGETRVLAYYPTLP